MFERLIISLAVGWGALFAIQLSRRQQQRHEEIMATFDQVLDDLTKAAANAAEAFAEIRTKIDEQSARIVELLDLLENGAAPAALAAKAQELKTLTRQLADIVPNPPPPPDPEP